MARRVASGGLRLKYTSNCKHFMRRGACRMGSACAFAHPGVPGHPTLVRAGLPAEFAHLKDDERYVRPGRPIADAAALATVSVVMAEAPRAQVVMSVVHRLPMEPAQSEEEGGISNDASSGNNASSSGITTSSPLAKRPLSPSLPERPLTPPLPTRHFFQLF